MYNEYTGGGGGGGRRGGSVAMAMWKRTEAVLGVCGLWAFVHWVEGMGSDSRLA